MASPLVWRDVWLLEIDPLDADHREMVHLLNAVFCADEDRNTPPVPLTERLDALLAHLRVHFELEERFLAAIDYPELAEHKREHAIQMAELVDLRRAVTETDARCLSEEAEEGIRRWFFNHVIAEDQRFARYYRARLGAGGDPLSAAVRPRRARPG
jgi:hemerythrin